MSDLNSTNNVSLRQQTNNTNQTNNGRQGRANDAASFLRLGNVSHGQPATRLGGHASNSWLDNPQLEIQIDREALFKTYCLRKAELLETEKMLPGQGRRAESLCEDALAVVKIAGNFFELGESLVNEEQKYLLTELQKNLSKTDEVSTEVGANKEIDIEDVLKEVDIDELASLATDATRRMLTSIVAQADSNKSNYSKSKRAALDVLNEVLADDNSNEVRRKNFDKVRRDIKNKRREELKQHFAEMGMNKEEKDKYKYTIENIIISNVPPAWKFRCAFNEGEQRVMDVVELIMMLDHDCPDKMCEPTEFFALLKAAVLGLDGELYPRAKSGRVVYN
jgi:hypothetical protein